MGTVLKLVSLMLVAVVAYIGIEIHNFERFLFKDQPVYIPNNTWWGPGEPIDEDQSIRQFTINVSDKVLTDLEYRLDRTNNLVPSIENSQQQYGINTELIKDIIEFWKTKYNWKERQAHLNKYPQFKTKIQGLDIHFIHVKPKNTNGLRVLPILLLHGWPGGITEFFDVIELLTTARKDKDFVFEVVVPSLPGFGFSDGPSKPGLSFPNIGVVFKNLMHRLGIKQFYVQGGDLGSIIGSNMAALFKEYVLGFHSNLCYTFHYKSLFKMLLGTIYPPAIVEKKYENRLYPLSDVFKFIMVESAYLHYHSTKPDTIGIGLSDSPVGLAAAVLEKMSTATNPNFRYRVDGGLASKYKYENLLDIIMIYWVTNSITTSMRSYAEFFNEDLLIMKRESIPIKVPVACAILEFEIFYFPPYVLKDRYHNIVHIAHYDNIGHFATLEAPEVLVNDIFIGIEKIEQLGQVK